MCKKWKHYMVHVKILKKYIVEETEDMKLDLDY